MQSKIGKTLNDLGMNKLEAYHKGSLSRTALTSYLIHVLHTNKQLAAIRALSVESK